jgi:hypothetical protein
MHINNLVILRHWHQRQRVPLNVQGQGQGQGVTFWFLILDSLLESIPFVGTEPTDRSLHPKLLRSACERAPSLPSILVNVGSHTHSYQEEAAADVTSQSLAKRQGNGKRGMGTSHPVMSQTVRRSFLSVLSHLDQQTQPAWAASSTVSAGLHCHVPPLLILHPKELNSFGQSV